MDLSDSNNRPLSASENRSISVHSQSRRTSKTIDSNQRKNFNSISTWIQLCSHSNENYAFHIMQKLLVSDYSNLINECDESGCNLLMYSLLYQRYKLFDLLLNETSVDLNFHAHDQQGNTILHYAVLYSRNESRVIDRLIEKYNKFAMDIDKRNQYGFTPLLLGNSLISIDRSNIESILFILTAIFCGRYELVFTLLTETDASPFARDHIQFKNLFDYIEIDVKNREYLNQHQSR